MNNVNRIIKPYLKKLILKTHPDYFHRDLIKKRVNQASLQKLNNILLETNNENSKVKLEFYIKGSKNKATVHFDTKDSEWFKLDTFFNLCKQVDIDILQSDLDMIQENITKELNKHKASYKTLAQEFADKLHQQQHTIKPFKPVDILNNPLIMFDPAVDKLAIANKLCHWLPELQPEKWWGKTPLLIVSASQLSNKLVDGMLIIHNEMNLKEIQAYIKNNLNPIQEK